MRVKYPAPNTRLFHNMTRFGIGRLPPRLTSVPKCLSKRDRFSLTPCPAETELFRHDNNIMQSNRMQLLMIKRRERIFDKIAYAVHTHISLLDSESSYSCLLIEQDLKNV